MKFSGYLINLLVLHGYRKPVGERKKQVYELGMNIFLFTIRLLLKACHKTKGLQER